MSLPIFPLFNFIKDRIRKRNWGDLIFLFSIIAGYGIYQNKVLESNKVTLNKLENKIVTIQSQIQQNNQSTIVQVGSDSYQVKKNQGDVRGLNTDNPINENWYKVGFNLDKEGNYCSYVSNNKYWSLWSKVSYPLTNNDIVIRIEIKPQRNPTIFVMSMGGYDGINAPRPVFQLNFFEGGSREIRIYGSDSSKPKGQKYLSNDPDFNKDIIINTTTRSIDSTSGELLVSFSIDYFSDGKANNYKTDEPFKIDTKYLKVEDGVRAQLGLGVSEKGCFRVSSVSIKN